MPSTTDEGAGSDGSEVDDGGGDGSDGGGEGSDGEGSDGEGSDGGDDDDGDDQDSTRPSRSTTDNAPQVPTSTAAPSCWRWLMRSGKPSADVSAS